MFVPKLNDEKHPGKFQIKMIFHQQLAHLELESDKNLSMKNCDQSLSGKVGI